MKSIRLWSLLCHATIVFSGMFLVFFCIDRVNPAMDFLGSEISKWVLLCFALCAMATASLTVYHIRRLIRRRYEKQQGK